MNAEAVLAIRVQSQNPNHHLWNNNGTWFIHYTVHQGGFLKQRQRYSLRTRSADVARVRRDEILSSMAKDYQS